MVKWFQYCLGLGLLSTLTYANAHSVSTIEIDQIILMLEWWDAVGSTLANLESESNQWQSPFSQYHSLSALTPLDPVETPR